MGKVMRFFSWWTLVFVVGSAFYIFLRYDQEKQQILDQVDELLLQASQSVKYILPEDFHREVRHKGITSAQDDSNIKRLTEFARERGIRFIYSMALSNSNVMFTASSINEHESIDNPEVRYGFIYNEASSTLKKAFTVTGKSSEEGEDRWGKFYAVYWTTSDSSGGKITSINSNNQSWVAGAEYRKEVYNDKLTLAIFEALRDLIYMCFLCSLLFFPYIKRLTRKIRGLTEDVKIGYSRYNKDIMHQGK